MNHAISGTPNDVSERLDRLAEELESAGVLDDAWREALRAAPRDRFVPARAWVRRGREVVALDRDRDPEAWWDAVLDLETPILTQLNDGAGPPDGATTADVAAEPSSSCPAPLIQFQMLQALDVSDGMTVLEVGTGSGWNAALLASRLGDQHVVTIEIDPTVARDAYRALRAVGRDPLVVTGDGRYGHPAGAPYDRIIATCAVHTVPYAWITQTRPGGIIVTPWVPQASPHGGPLARLTVGQDGAASGLFVGTVGFMRLRQQRRPDGQPPPGLLAAGPPPSGAPADPFPGTVRSTTTVDPVALLFHDSDTAFPAQLSLGEGHYGIVRKRASEEMVVWLSDPARSSWALVHSSVPFGATAPDGTRFVVEQYGPRRLWDEVETAHRWWQHAGRPGRLRFGLTVTTDAQTIWLDDPGQPVLRLPSPSAPAFIGTMR
jgi:protein-L-isoaspartate O-methyltransferase